MAQEPDFPILPLKEACVHRLLTEMIATIKGVSGQEYIVMVVDSASVHILSSALNMFSVTQQGVMVIEKLELDRKVMSDSDALYFLTPSNSAITRVVSDFKGKRQYRFAHVVWTSDLDSNQMDFIANSDMLPFIKTFKIAHMEFLISDPDVFHFGMSSGLNELYVQAAAEALDQVATLLSQVCGALHEQPFIGYKDTSQLTQRLALATQQKVDMLFAAVPVLTCTNPRATLLILDRNYDLTTPLMHDTHYETLVYDLLPVREDNTISYNSVDGSNEVRGKTATLDARDQLWMDLKYLEIDEAVDTLSETFQKFAEGHSDLQEIQAKQARISNTQKMAKIVKALPQYNEMLAKYAAHMNLTDSCMDAFLNSDVKPCTELEQKMATGLDSEGSEIKVGQITETLIRMLQGLSSDELRLRLVLMYCCSYEISEQDRRKLFDILKPPEIQAVQNLRIFGLEVQSEGRRTVARSSQQNLREVKARVKASQKAFNYAVPRLDDIVKKALTGNFADFLFTKEAPSEAVEVEAKPGLPKSLRKPKAVPTFANSGRGSSKPRLIIFIVGGLSLTECRVAQSLSKTANIKVVIGGTKLMRANEFASQVMTMHGSSLHDRGSGVGLAQVNVDIS